MARRRRYNRNRNYRRRMAYRRRRTYRRRAGKPSLTVVRSPQIAPDRYRCKLKYMSSHDFSTITGGTTWYQFRGNSCFDPYYTGVGSQPVGFDQLSTLYNDYRVYASSCRVEFCATATSNVPVVCLINASDSATGIASLGLLAATLNPYSRHTYTGASTGNRAVVALKNYMTTKRIFGEKNAQDEDYKAVVTANPTNSWFWNIGTASSDGATSAALIGVVYITYYVEFSNLTALDYS